MAESKPEHKASSSEEDVKATSILDKPEKSLRHQPITMKLVGGVMTSRRILPLTKLNASNLFECVKEEFEAIAEAIHPPEEIRQ